jgi:membrane dipeptidase
MGIFLGDNDISIETMLRHICYVSELVGADHVGLGFDYSPQLDIDVGAILKSRPDYWPAGQRYDTPDIKHAGPPQLHDLLGGLKERGFSNTEIEGIFGENFRQVASAAWAGE